MTKKKGIANKIDKHVGERLRQRRVLLGLSQEKAAEIAGVTFQQIQKYERGLNRISASRLYTLSKGLGVSLDYFYDGMTAIKKENDDIPENPMGEKDIANLVRCYCRLPEGQKKSFLKFVGAMTNDT